MAIKPSPTIAGKLRKLFSNNKQTIEPAIGDSIPGGSGSGGGLKLSFIEVETGVPQAVVDAAEVYYPDSPYGYRYYLCDKTASEIQSSFDNGSVIWVIFANWETYVVVDYHYDEENSVYVAGLVNASTIRLVFVGDAVWEFEKETR